MQLTVLEQSYEFKNEPGAIDDLFVQINQSLEAVDLVVSHLCIDEVDVYENHYDYILENISNIKSIEVKCRTMQEMINDVLLSAEEYLQRAIPEVKILSNQLYDGLNESAWDKIEQLLEGVQWLLHMSSIMHDNQVGMQDEEAYFMFTTQLLQHAQVMEEAMNNRDIVLMADIISYEILPLLESLQTSVSEQLDRAGVRQDVN